MLVPRSPAPSPRPATTSPAKKTVAAISDAVGFDTLDLGGLDEAWRVDRGQPAFIAHLDLAELRANVARADRSRSGR
jgi:8-hydroxy-5-deazaflavin:NADPH oxidoreductase